MPTWPLLLATIASAQPFQVQLEGRVPWEVDPDLADEALELAHGMAPPHAGHVQVVAEGPDGQLRPLEDYLPPIPPVPEKYDDLPTVSWSSTQPVDHPGETSGFLTDRAVYLSQCHGWIWYDSLDRFSTQRGNVYDTVEDFHNPEGANQYLVAYLENAGAAVFTTKDRGMNPLSVVIDNDAPSSGGAYSETGDGFEDAGDGWAASSSWTYGSDPFDQGSTRRFPASGDAVATWVPDVPEDGWYAVYVSWDSDAENAPDAHYRFIHPGGSIDRYYDQTVHGSTWQYSETLWLPAGPGGLTVELLSDSASTGRWLSADAVRVGGGMGDVSRHGGTTGRPRWEEGAILYTQYNGAPTSVYDPYSDGDGSDPSSRSRWAAWEHPTGEDAVYLSWHSNAFQVDAARGTVTYTYEGSSGSAVDGSYELATNVQDEMIDAFRTLWESDWQDRGLNSDAFSEVNPSHNPEMPAALVELAFHDHVDDVAHLKNPQFRRDASRAMYRGIVRYFAERDGLVPVFLPEPPQDLAVVHDEDGRLEASWTAGASGAPYGDAADSYLLYTSADGRSWDKGTEVQGTSTTVSARQGETIYLRVGAVNSGGVSFPSEVLGARRSPDGLARVLVVSAFDRLEVSTLVWEDVGSSIGEVQRMFLRRMNAFDTAVAHGEAIVGAGWYFDSIADERLSEVGLDDYDLVIWVAGEQSTSDETFTSSQQDRLRSFVEGGGALWASGAEILWDLDYRGDASDQAFASEILGAGMADDDAGTTAVDGVGLLAGLTLDFAEADGAPYPVEYPDSLDSTREALASYAGGDVAAVLGQGVALFGFPFECIGDEAARAELAARLLPELVPDYDPPEPEDDTGLPDDSVTARDSGASGPFPDGAGRVRMEPARCGCASTRSAVGFLSLLCALLVPLRRRHMRAS